MTRFSPKGARALLLATATLVPALAAVPALANTAPAAPTDTAASAEGAPIDNDSDIVVTARHRNESLQQVPIAISAVTGSSLNDRALHNLQDLSAAVPTIDFRNGSSNKDRTVFIRGVGTISTSPGVEPSVSTVVDGVVLTRPGQATMDLGEVDHVEVLRGPQGTLFGKNASAGVINIVTAAPSDTFHAYGEAGATTDSEYRLKAGITGPIAPGITARIDGLYTHYNGNVTNVTTGDKVNGFERYGARGKLQAEPAPGLKITLAGDYLQSHDTVPTGVYASTSQTAYPSGVVTNSAALAASLAASGVTAGADNRTIATNFDSDVHDKNYGASLTTEWETKGYTLTSITAWRGWKNHQHQDYDMLSQTTSSFPAGEDHGDVSAHQVSQELRLASPKGHLIDYVVGAFFLHSADDERYERDMTFATTAPVTGIANYGMRDNNYALFGEANINFTRNFRAIAGYRSTWDDLSYYHVRTSTNDPNNTGLSTYDTTGIRAYHNTTGSTSARGDSARVGLQYDLGKHNQVYATWSRGYKGPAYDVYFNMRSLNATTPLDEIALKPETSSSWEAGLKGSTANHALSYALAIYTTTFHNYQANYSDIVGGAIVTRLINAGTVRSQGVEADVTLHPITGLSLSTSLAYTDAKVAHFTCPVGAAASCDVDGQTLPYAPRWKLYENAAYRFGLTRGLDLELQSDISLRSKTQYQLTETPNTIQPSYAIWNASAALLGKDNGWQLRVYVKNITNTHYSDYLANGTYAGTVRLVPRDDARYAGFLIRKDF